MPSILPRFEKLNWLFSQFVLSALFFTGTAYSASPNIPDPSQKGPYDVGFVEIDVMLPSDFPRGTEATTKVTVMYPVPAGTSPAEPGPNTRYQLRFLPFFTLPYDSPINAVRDATPEYGSFKLIVMQHGGAAVPPPDASLADFYIKNLETLASHGFVTLVYTRRSFGPDLLGLVENAIDKVVQAAVDHEIGGPGGASIPINVDEMGKPDKMGIMGFSGGGNFVAQKTFGNGGIPIIFGPVYHGPDPHFAAAIYLDTVGEERFIASDEQLATSTVPYLQLRGSLFEFDPFRVQASDEVFAMTTAVSPRYKLLINYFSHAAPASSYCDIIDILRDTALLLQPGVEPLDFIGPPIDPLGEAVRFVWAFDSEFTGSGREVCETLGVDAMDPNTTDNHSIRNVVGIQDFGPPDGINDYYTNFSLNTVAQANLPGVDLSTAAVPIDGGNEDFNELIARYQVAFFKVHLDEDRHYQPFLTPGFAYEDDRVTLEVTGGNGGKIK